MAGENKVFISYRRKPTQYLALLLFKELHKRGYDVFWDIEGIGAGRFEQVILTQIKARTFFIVLLAHGTLDRVYDAGDWLRREIEYAIEHQRIVVPVLVDDFTFEQARKFLQTGSLQQLSEYNAAPLRIEFFDASVDKLCKQFLVIDEHIPELTPLTEEIMKESENIIEEAVKAPEPTEEQKSAEELFRSAYNKAETGDYDGAIADFTASIEKDGDAADAYYNRGLAYRKIGNNERAVQDYNKAIELQPDDATAYNNRGFVYYLKGDYEQAIQDYNKAIELNPYYVNAYDSRGEAYFALEQYQEALDDFTEAFQLDSDLKYAVAGLAITHHALGNIGEAQKLWRQLLEKDERYKDAEWVGKELDWPDPLIAEARKLIAGL